MSNPEHRRRSAVLVGLWAALTMPCVAFGAAQPASESLAANLPRSVGGTTNPTLQDALQKVMFPGVTINVQERCVDVEGSVCLHRGGLELVACTKGTKEHESIVMIEAKPMHIHAALLLLGARPGSPATRKQWVDQPERWTDVPPRGGRWTFIWCSRAGRGRWSSAPSAISSPPPAADPMTRLLRTGRGGSRRTPFCLPVPSCMAMGLGRDGT
jgi:hypothetical protein